MDRARGKQPLEEDVKVQTSIDSDESDAGDDEWTSILRRSKAEYDSLQKKKGAETSEKHQRGADWQLCRGLEFYQFLQSLA
ncbi:hypothetical protein TIFTF001_040389 [Ficus carica]|uniref:Uncharacterized protein n=1 Tax=Ficus carica TaxID=3494 RepID=A0AA88D024_FICCA|nr:hypothetical protein TIFTF001_040389 [Ficus carica]